MRFDYEGLKILKNELDIIKDNNKYNQNIDVKEIYLQNRIVIKNVSFKYKIRNQLILDDISF